MWKQISKLAGKMILIVLPVVLLLQMICLAFPNAYMDGEYAMYKQQKDYLSKNHDYNKVLIIGDSRAKASFVPAELGESVYNLSLGGISPVESYFMLKEYLENHDAPEYLILAYAPIHQCQVDPDADDFVLWNRCVYFHTFNKNDLFEIKATAKNYQNTQIIDRDHFYLEYMMYQLYFPNKYGTALKKAIFENRYQKNKDTYVLMENQKGYSLFGTEGVNGGFNAEAKKDDFAEADLIEYYYREIFSLCKEHNIQAVVEQLPMTETSYYALTSDFRHHYDDYLSRLATDYPEVSINKDLFAYPDAWFGDIDHLNPEGASTFSQAMKAKYPQIF